MLSIVALIYILGISFAAGINISKVEPANPVVFVPIAVGDKIIFIAILSETVPAAPIDDNTMGHVDADADGVRDDVEREIALLAPTDREYRGYLYHLAYYTRRLLMAPAESNADLSYEMSFEVVQSLLEILKARVCLTSAKGERDAARVLARHMDSKSRFTEHYQKEAFAENIPMVLESYDCTITNLEPISD